MRDNSHPQNHDCNRPGFTLVELLVVISILTVLIVLIIPQLRMITRDRNIREAARVVGSVFAGAQARAASEGNAGVRIQRNPNFSDGVSNYAGMTLYQLRALPPYAGDDWGNLTDAVLDADEAGLFRIGNAPVQIRVVKPQGQITSDGSDDLDVIKPFDTIQLNYSSFGYVITAVQEVNPGYLDLTIDLNTARYPEPPHGVFPSAAAVADANMVKVHFRVNRRPRVMQSTAVVLPNAHHVDLRFSGPLDTSGGKSWFTQTFENQLAVNPAAPVHVDVIFGGSGAVDRIFSGVESLPQNQSLYFFVTNSDPDGSSGYSDPLDNPDALWISVNNSNGNVNVGANLPPAATLYAQRLAQARGLALERKAATQ